MLDASHVRLSPKIMYWKRERMQLTKLMTRVDT